MTDDDRLPIPQMEAFRQELMDAAVREASPAGTSRSSHHSRRRRRRRLAIALPASLAVVAAVAGATQLISVGEPVDRFRNDVPIPKNRIDTGGIVIDTIAPDPAVGRAFGAGVFDLPDGRSCVIGGQVRGDQLGLVQDGKFRPFARKLVSATCHRFEGKAHRMTWNFLRLETSPPRLLLVGRANPGRDLIAEARFGARRITTKVGRRGAFLFVLSTTAKPQPYSRMNSGLTDLLIRDAAGRRITRK